MSEPIKLKGVDTVQQAQPAKIGISYSGGGPLLVVELGVARAFVQKGIRPDVICGASAGGLTAAAHALDPDTGRGIDMAANLLGAQVRNSFLKLDPLDFAQRVIREGKHLNSIGDNSPIAKLIGDGIAQTFGLQQVTMGTFGKPLSSGGKATPQLMIVATDDSSGESYWYEDDALLTEALIATSAIPGVFPWVTHQTSGGQQVVLVDGGVVDNQPLSNLLSQGCGTIYACAVGASAPRPEPTNLLQNYMQAINLAMHQCEKLEESYVRAKLPDGGKILHIHPETKTAVVDFDFTPDLVKQVMDEATNLTIAWLETNPSE
ncbi:MAG: patatin-like phospholipase family protein [Chloroflexi bacterium]|nr:patatin-like phospholipase family protein [Chloroflexota bacterium]